MLRIHENLAKKIRIKFFKSAWILTILIPSTFSFSHLVLILAWHFDNFDSFNNFSIRSVFELIFWSLWFPEDFPRCLCFYLGILITLTPNWISPCVSVFPLKFCFFWLPSNRFSDVSLFFSWNFASFDSL